MPSVCGTKCKENKAIQAEELRRNPPTQAQIEEKNKASRNAFIITGSVIGGIVLFFVVILGVYWFMKKRKNKIGGATSTNSAAKKRFNIKEKLTKMKRK
jgi:hypothetical protein